MINDDALNRVIDRMEKDLRAFEDWYGGKYLEDPYYGLGNRKTHCVNEATLPIVRCSPVCLARCARTCYVVTGTTAFRAAARRRQAQNTVLRRIDPARELGFAVPST